MKKKYTVPALKIDRFSVEDIITESTTNVWANQNTIVDGKVISFDDGNTLESIDYTKFFK